VVSKSSSVASIPNDPFNTRGRPSVRAGLDLKDRLTSNLTLDATLNPDFGQVEVDPAVLNLSAFETFFPEKRPFFVEGAQVFNFGGFSCNFCSNVEGMSAFYSRRIGRPPSGASLATDPNAFADVPDATTILAAGKITGRTGNGFTVGLLNAVTSEANARVETLDGARGKQEVEPLADYFVARLKRDYLRVGPVPDARTALDQIAGWFDDYNENHPHSGLRMRSPREFRRAHQPAEVSG